MCKLKLDFHVLRRLRKRAALHLSPAAPLGSPCLHLDSMIPGYLWESFGLVWFGVFGRTHCTSYEVLEATVSYPGTAYRCTEFTECSRNQSKTKYQPHC